MIQNSMQGYVGNIEQETVENADFRKVVSTGPNLQLVVMSLLPGEEIGLEHHDTHDQFFRFEAGEGKVVMNGEEASVKAGDAAIVPAGTEHNVINTSSSEALRLYTIYAPPQHAPGTVHPTKADAEAAEKAKGDS